MSDASPPPPPPPTPPAPPAPKKGADLAPRARVGKRRSSLLLTFGLLSPRDRVAQLARLAKALESEVQESDDAAPAPAPK
jgi:hypothetical protein